MSYSTHYVLSTEGTGRIGLLTCLRCGAAVILGEDEGVTIHDKWHDEQDPKPALPSEGSAEVAASNANLPLHCSEHVPLFMAAFGTVPPEQCQDPRHVRKPEPPSAEKFITDHPFKSEAWDGRPDECAQIIGASPERFNIRCRKPASSHASTSEGRG